jgi:hypothetical protein
MRKKKNFVYISHLPHAFYVPRPSHLITLINLCASYEVLLYAVNQELGTAQSVELFQQLGTNFCR